MADIRTKILEYDINTQQELHKQFKIYADKHVHDNKAIGELGNGGHTVSLMNASHIIKSMNFYGTGVEVKIEILDTNAGNTLKYVFDHTEFRPVFNLDNEIMAINAFPKRFEGVFFPHEFNSNFPFGNTKQHWHIHRMSEHHNQPAWMQSFDKKRFILYGIDALGHERNAIFIVPESIQYLFEFLLSRGRLEHAKMLGLIFDELVSFKDADIINARPMISVEDKYLYPKK